MVTSRIFYCLGLSFGFLLLACETATPSADETVVTFRMRQAETTSPQSLSVGEDCTSVGHAGCLSSICIHFGKSADQGYACSETCNIERDCPDRWTCSPLIPGAGDSFCVPPSSWKGGQASKTTKAKPQPSSGPAKMPNLPAVF